MAKSGESPRVYPTFAGRVAAAALLAALGACGGGGGDGDDVAADPDARAADVDASTAIDAAAVIDAPAPIDAPPAENFAMYRIQVGRHDADIIGGDNTNPIRQITMVNGRDFRFAFNASAMYVLTN